MSDLRGSSGPAAPAALRAAALTVLPAVVRQLTSPAAQRRARVLLDAVRRTNHMERLPFLLTEPGARHPLAPAAVRFERTRGAGADQTAVTVWFQEGPALPATVLGSGPRGGGHTALRIGAGLLGAAALAVASTAAARLAAEPPPRLHVVTPVVDAGP